MIKLREDKWFVVLGITAIIWLISFVATNYYVNKSLKTYGVPTESIIAPVGDKNPKDCTVLINVGAEEGIKINNGKAL